jgi:hypothetical protein
MCVVKWPSDIKGEIIHRSLNNVMSFILGVKWVPKIKMGPLIFGV